MPVLEEGQLSLSVVITINGGPSVVWKTYVPVANGKLHLTWTLENDAVCILSNTRKSHISPIIISNKIAFQ